jgi:hypothetical protein
MCSQKARYGHVWFVIISRVQLAGTTLTYCLAYSTAWSYRLKCRLSFNGLPVFMSKKIHVFILIV